ncbi:2-aminoadipate aminotransferase [Paenibacillus aceti]|uniref:2-aminoadipate aminotransferase n=1 Tax=Paenibacillus aceti TaxID=1820010 RepID=A0ABQ1VNP4_9BACL|nr:2-aminoadipate aminotransferase [Paenibacillus aceti]
MNVEGWLKQMIERLPGILGDEIEGFIRDGDLISFAGGCGGELPAIKQRLERIEEELQRAGRLQGEEELEEAAAEASVWLQQWLCSAYEQVEGGDRGAVAAAADRLLLQDSAAAALELVFSALLKPGDAVLVETPSSPEALWALRSRGAIPVPVSCDRDGMLPDDLRRLISAAKPALVYVTPPHSAGPSGAVWSQQRKLALLEQCDRHRVPIVEDGTPSGVPGFARAAAGRGGALGAGSAPHGEPSDSLYSLWHQDAKGEGTSVIGLDACERALFPAQPLAWLRADAAMLDRLAAAHPQAALLSPAACRGRLMLHSLLADASFSLMQHAAEILAEYEARRIYMKQLFKAADWRGIEIHDPGFGLFLWLRLPEEIDPEALLRASLLEGTAFVPSHRCYAPDQNTPDPELSPLGKGGWLRLNFAAYPSMGIAEGVARIGDALSAFTARS